MTESEISKIAEIVERVKEDEKDAFAQLYDCVHQKVYLFAYAVLKERFLSEDVVQEVFIIIYNKINELNNNRLFVAWINQITYYTALDIREKNMEIPMEKTFFEMKNFFMISSDTDVVFQETMNNEQNRVLYNRIMKLPIRMRTALVMRYYNEYSLVEISAALDCPLGTVKSRLNTAKKKLRCSS